MVCFCTVGLSVLAGVVSLLFFGWYYLKDIREGCWRHWQWLQICGDSQYSGHEISWLEAGSGSWKSKNMELSLRHTSSANQRFCWRNRNWFRVFWVKNSQTLPTESKLFHDIELNELLINHLLSNLGFRFRRRRTFQLIPVYCQRRTMEANS